MAVTLTRDELAAEMRLGDGTTALEEPTLGIVNRLLAVGTALAGVYAPNAPDAVANEAVARVAGFLFDSPPANARRFTAVLEQSGAASILRPVAAHSSHQPGC